MINNPDTQNLMKVVIVGIYLIVDWPMFIWQGGKMNSKIIIKNIEFELENIRLWIH